MKDLTNIEWNDAEPDHPDVTFQSFVVTPTVIEIWNAMYRDGDTDLLDFIKDIKKNPGTVKLPKISPRQYKIQTEPYWKILKCHKKNLNNLRLQLATARELKTSVTDKNNLFDTAITSLQTMEADYGEARDRIMALNDSLNPPVTKITRSKRLFEGTDDSSSDDLDMDFELDLDQIRRAEDRAS